MLQTTGDVNFRQHPDFDDSMIVPDDLPEEKQINAKYQVCHDYVTVCHSFKPKVAKTFMNSNE